MKRDTSRFHVNALVDPRAVDDPATLFNLAILVFQLFSSLPNMDASHITAIEPQSFQTVIGRTYAHSSRRRRSPDTGPTLSIVDLITTVDLLAIYQTRAP